MKKQSVLSFCGVVLFAQSVLGAGPWYVAKEDPNAADTLVEGRGTEALPFRTIQAALDNKDFEAGDTVYVKRGVYDEGGKVDSSNGMTNRVYITKKVHLKALGARRETIILGRHSDEPVDTNRLGMGPGAIRCVCVKGAADTVIEGFTLQDGATDHCDGSVPNNNKAGGLLVYDNAKDVYLVDCAVVNCLGRNGGGMRGGTAVRCLFDRCGGTSNGGCIDCTYAFSCVMTHAVVGYPIGSDADTYAVNCTIICNSSGGIGNTAKSFAYNCIFAGNSGNEVAGSKCTLVDTLQTSTAAEGKYMVFSPATEDYRIVKGGSAIGFGKTANFDVLTDLGVPAEYLKYDFLGSPIDTSVESVNAGAVQGVAGEPACARVSFSDGFTLAGRACLSSEWVCSDSYPVQYLVKPTVPDDKTFYAYVRTTVSGGTEPTLVYLQPDGQVWITPPPASALATQAYTAKYAAAEFWTDPTSAEGGDGSVDSPFRKLQDAVDAVSADYTLIRAKPGDYKEGGRTWSNLLARVDFTSGGKGGLHIFLRAEEGPANTAICGAADNGGTNANEPGCGPNAVRCVLLNNYSAVQGFTLRDGHTFDSSAETVPEDGATSDYRKNGAAVYTPLNSWIQPYQLLDCIITNCVGSKSIVFWGFTSRNRIVGNTTSGVVEHRGWHSTELVLNNSCGGFGTDGGSYWFSTFVNNVKSPGADEFVNFYGTDSAYGCVLVGGSCARKRSSGSDIGNFYWKQTSFACMSEFSFAVDPLLVDDSGSDCRPYMYSPALGACPNDNRFYIYAGSDLNYGSLAIAADGKLSAGCFQNNLPSAVWFADRAGNVETNAVEAGSALTRGIPSATHPNWQKGTATLQEGAALDVNWTAAGSLREFAATVEGAGTLSVLLNGKMLGAVTAADGKKPFSFRPSDTGDTVRFAYAGEGSATLADFKSGAGLMLILR